MIKITIFSILILTVTTVFADECSNLPKHSDLQKALLEARKTSNGGLNLDMWGTIVDRSGIVCAVAFTGEKFDSQWPASRVISAQKANTSNGFSLKGLALSTANLYSAVQPGGPLFGLQESNPVDTKVAYDGDSEDFGTKKDPMTGKRVGGINVFGGGLALYNSKGEILGAIGVSGDTSCADHNIAWKIRSKLELDYVPGGVSADKNDQIIFDINPKGKSAGGYGHPDCGGNAFATAKELSKTRFLK
ncbi:MAG: heme-binding protein [Bacteriovoracales bacterium]